MLREYEQALEGDPTLDEPFLFLRKAYTDARQWDKIVTLYELRAQSLTDGPKASELFYLAAQVRMEHLSDEEGAEADLAHALDRDPDNRAAAQVLKAMYRQAGRLVEYMQVFEMEASALARHPDSDRRLALSIELGHFCQETFDPLARRRRVAHAVGLVSAQLEVTPEQLKLVVSARKIHRALGEFPSVVQLYELELGLVSEPRRRGELLLSLGRTLSERLGDLTGAASRLEEAMALLPHGRASEALARVYWQLGWQWHERGEVGYAVAMLRKALIAVPGHAASAELIEQILYGDGRLEELDRYYRERAIQASDLQEKLDYLFRRAQLAENDRNDTVKAVRIYLEALELEPPGGPAAKRLGEIYATSPNVPLVQLAQTDQAETFWKVVLQGQPNHPEVLPAYARMLADRGRWGTFADLLESAIEQGLSDGTDPKVLSEQVTAISEQTVQADHLAGDIKDKVAASERLALLYAEKLEAPEYAIGICELILSRMDSTSQKAVRLLDRLYVKQGDWPLAAQVLEREVQLARGDEKLDHLRRLVAIYDDRLRDVARSAQTAAEILKFRPSDKEMLARLELIFERAGDFPRLVETLEIYSHYTTSVEEDERITRSIAHLLERNIKDVARATEYWEHLLLLVPGDPESLSALARIYQDLGQAEELAGILEQQAAAAPDEYERADRLRALARHIDVELGQRARARLVWERVRAIRPRDRAALAALRTSPSGGLQPSRVGSGSSPSPGPRVFVSHASSDHERVERDIIALLGRHGVDHWYSAREIRTSEEWKREIYDGLQGCDWFLVAVTSAAARSQWVKVEVDWAFQHRPGRIVPVLLEKRVIDGIDHVDKLDLRLRGIQHVDFQSPTDSHRETLLRTWRMRLTALQP
jgi:golgin subfamily B member 1